MKLHRLLWNIWAAVALLLLTTASALAQRGNGDGGQYRILQALYGTAERSVDVTERLKELARQDQSFRIENNLFGVDPDEGRVKTLRIYARGPDGANRIFEYREGSVVDGSQFSGWRGGDWGRGGWGGGPAELRIIRATYGAGRRQIDVTERMRILAGDGRLQLRVSNHSAGGDPAPGMPKSLRVTYSVGGRQQQVRVEEGGQLDIP